MSKQAIVGIFTLLGLVGLFVVYFVLADLGSRLSGYQIGVHFTSAAGLQRGGLVYESGVQVGTVESIHLLDDFTVDVIASIKNNFDIPRDSKFLIDAPLTGAATLTIVPPRRPKGQVALLERRVLPLDQQPTGTSPVTISDLMQQGAGELKKVDSLLAELQMRAPAILDSLESTARNANELTINANGAMQRLARHGDEMVAQLQQSLSIASSNIDDLTKQLDATMRGNRGKIDALLDSMNRTGNSLAAATDQLNKFAQNPQLRDNLLTTTTQLAKTSTNIANLTTDLQHLTGDPSTQAQLKNTVSNVDAATQRLTSLLGAIGGKSSVYGVDAGATPPPAPPGGGGGRIVPGTPPPYVPPASQDGRPKNNGEVTIPPAMRARLTSLTHDLVQVQFRITELSKQAANAQNTALLNSSRGPQSDFNLVFLPKLDKNIVAGVNDLSANQTFNLVGVQKMGSNASMGAGILYSRLGVMGAVGTGIFGAEGKAYFDPRRGYLDAYLHFRPAKSLDLFAGERDMTHLERRSVYGLQLQFQLP